MLSKRSYIPLCGILNILEVVRSGDIPLLNLLRKLRIRFRLVY